MNKYGSFSGGILGSLFKKPATKGYPFVQREYPERTRGSIVIDIDGCIFCGLCEKKCPSSAIKVDRNAGTWSIDRMGCVQCENCVVGCPKKVLSTDVHYTAPSTERTVDTFKKAGAEISEATGGASMPNADLDKCVFCGLCAKNCPQGALQVDRASKSWKLDETLCVSCGLCVEKCPKKCIEMGADATKTPVTLPQYDIDDLPLADASACVYCGLCASACPQGAIEMDRDAKTWVINEDKCIHCGICYYKCPKKCIKMVDAETATAQPEEKKAEAAVSLPKADLDKCVFCTLCAKNCPQGALTVDRASKTWKLDAESCVSCGLCVDKCPKKCIDMSAGSAAEANEPEFKRGYEVDATPEADTDLCVFCGICQKACPQDAITVDRENKTWVIDEDKCIHCAICAYKCPKKCIDMR